MVMPFTLEEEVALLETRCRLSVDRAAMVQERSHGLVTVDVSSVTRHAA
jgi:hypothetical protein